MKCVKFTGRGTPNLVDRVRRLPDDEAKALVNSKVPHGYWEYCPKSLWKEVVRDVSPTA